MKNYRLLFFVFFLLPFAPHAQITTDPELPVASQKVTIIFDSSKESRLGYYEGPLYAHTGVIIEGSSNWQYEIGSWGNNEQQPVLQHVGDGIYELVIEPDMHTYYDVPEGEKITRLAFVFRTADAGRQTEDLFVNVYNNGLLVRIASPDQNALIYRDQPSDIVVHATEEAALKLFLDNQLLAEDTAESVTLSHTFTETGYHWLKVTATSADTTATDSLQLFVMTEVNEESLPEQYRKGINYTTDTSAALVLWAPEKEFVFVLGDFNEWMLDIDYQMNRDGEHYWLEIGGLEAGKEYAFQYSIDGSIRVADPYAEKILDPWNDEFISEDTYPGLLPYPGTQAAGIVSVMQPGQEEFQWEVTDFQVPEVQKLVIYELLIRDFTEEHTFKSVTEKLDYLLDLNINVLELMPVNEFEGNSSWGYNPSFYFAPDKYYGPKDELKKLIDECHKRGIAVVIDMVLNHSYGQSPFVQMYMNNWTISPGNPWYNVESNFQNENLRWGYDFNHASEATQELIDSINSFWINEYKVDGFRFDFTKGFSNTPYGQSSWGSEYDAGRIANLKRMTDEIKERKQDALIIFEHLADNEEEKELTDYGILMWGNVHDIYTEAARGNAGNSDLNWSLYTSRGWNAPHLVSYFESHDEERIIHELYNSGFVEGSYNVRDLPVALKRMELISVFHLPLPGPKMIWQFGERGYDVSIDDYGGRLSEKPPRWEYLQEENRLELFYIMSQLNHLKQSYEEFSPDSFNSHLANDMRWYSLRSNNNHVYTIGNFGTLEHNSIFTFPGTGRWYEFFTGDSIDIDSEAQTLTLAPGEYRMYSTRKFEKTQVITDIPVVEQTTGEVTLYPNPAKNEITVTAFPEIQEIKIFSTTGNLVFHSKSIKSNSSKIYVGNFLPGMYFMQVNQKNKVITHKFLVE